LLSRIVLIVAPLAEVLSQQRKSDFLRR